MKSNTQSYSVEQIYKEALVRLKRDTTENNNIAVRLLNHAVSLGHVDAMNELGRLYYKGLDKVLVKNGAEAFRLFLLAAGGGSAKSYYNVARLFEDGVVSSTGAIPKDLDSAVEYYSRATFAGYFDAVKKLKQLAVDQTGAIKHIGACFELGKIFVEKKFNDEDLDLPLALSFLRLASNARHSGSNNLLGCMYANGQVDGVPNLKEALRYFTLSGDDAYSQYNLAILMCDQAKQQLEEANKIEQANDNSLSLEEMRIHDELILPALNVLKKAAESDLAEAQYLYGKMLVGGANYALSIHSNIPFTTDTSQGIRCLEQAAIYGYKDAQFLLSELYSKGMFGVAENPMLAHKWLTRFQDRAEAGLQHEIISLSYWRGGSSSEAVSDISSESASRSTTTPVLTPLSYMSSDQFMEYAGRFVLAAEVSEAILNNNMQRTKRLEMEYIESNSQLLEYYNTLNSTLYGMFVACAAIKTGLIDNSAIADQQDKATQAIAYATKAIEFLTGSIPIVSHISQAVTIVAKQAIEISNDNKVKRLLALVPDQTETIEKVSQASRIITIALEDKIKLLPVEKDNRLVAFFKRQKDKVIVNDVDTVQKAEAVTHAMAIIKNAMTSSISSEDFISEKVALIIDPELNLEEVRKKREAISVDQVVVEIESPLGSQSATSVYAITSSAPVPTTISPTSPISGVGDSSAAQLALLSEIIRLRQEMGEMREKLADAAESSDVAQIRRNLDEMQRRLINSPNHTPRNVGGLAFAAGIDINSNEGRMLVEILQAVTRVETQQTVIIGEMAATGQISSASDKPVNAGDTRQLLALGEGGEESKRDENRAINEQVDSHSNRIISQRARNNKSKCCIIL